MNTSWDSLGLSGVSDAIQDDDRKLLEKFEFYKKHPNRPKWVMAACTIFTATLWVLFFKLDSGTSNSLSNSHSGQIYLFALLPPLIYYYTIKELEKSFAELIIAQQCGWQYDPKDITDKATLLTPAFPEIFHPEAHSQYVSDQFWGSIGPAKTPFWICTVGYTIGDGRNAHSFYETLYAFKLPHLAAGDFILMPESKLHSFFSHPGITTESSEFNKRFRIEYHGDRGLQGQDIFQVLTPTAQEHLVTLQEKTGPFTLLFREDCMLISFKGELKLNHTNFFKAVALDPRDEEELEVKLQNILQLGDDILPCID